MDHQSQAPHKARKPYIREDHFSGGRAILRGDFSVIVFEKGKNGISVVNQERLDPI